jgi:hypothetical protein
VIKTLIRISAVLNRVIQLRYFISISIAIVVQSVTHLVHRTLTTGTIRPIRPVARLAPRGTKTLIGIPIGILVASPIPTGGHQIVVRLTIAIVVNIVTHFIYWIRALTVPLPVHAHLGPAVTYPLALPRRGVVAVPILQGIPHIVFVHFPIAVVVQTIALLHHGLLTPFAIQPNLQNIR